MATDLRLEFETASSAIDPSTVELTGLEARAELCRPYEVRIDLSVAVDSGLDQGALEDLLKAPCRVAYGQEEGRVEVHGVLRRIEIPSANEASPVAYRATLVPRIWALGQFRRSRVFQGVDPRAMITAILEEQGFEEDTHFEWHLSSSYPVSEYVVQYQESDLDFVHRTVEHHGIWYFFRQTPDGEVVVFTDDNSTCVELEGFETLDYYAAGVSEHQGVLELSRALTPRPAMVLLRDYNWRTPSVQLQSEAPADETTGRGFHNEYGQHFKNPSEGSALAKVRAEELLVARDVFHGRCRLPGLLPGHKVEVIGHPLLDFDQTYLVTAVEHEAVGGEAHDAGGGSGGFTSRFTAIPHRVPYRRPRTTARPKIEGIMHAVVDGEVPGTAAPIDEFGRYKIIFPFDLVGQSGGKATRWVRLAQPASGAGYGIHFPLHIGVEVAVSHLDGDPDRPIIMNSPPNTETVTPVNATNPTQSEIVTKTGIRMTWDDDA